MIGPSSVLSAAAYLFNTATSSSSAAPVVPSAVAPIGALTARDNDALAQEMYERDHRHWYIRHGPTLTGYVNSAKQGVRSLLTLSGTNGLSGRVANWTLGPARPDITRLINDLRTATVASASGPGSPAAAQSGIPKGYDDPDLQSRVSALSAFPAAMSEFWNHAEINDVHALREVARRGPGDLEVESALRVAAARAYSDITSRSEAHSSSSFFGIGGIPPTHEASGIPGAYATSGLGPAQWSGLYVDKLASVLPSFKPMTEERKKKIESDAWRSDLISYVPRTMAYCASSLLPGPLGALGTVASLIA